MNVKRYIFKVLFTNPDSLLASNRHLCAITANFFVQCGSNGGSFCKVRITADLFGAICRAFFLSLKFACFMIISRSLVKGFLTMVKISTQNHQNAHKFKYETSTSHESKASQLA